MAKDPQAALSLATPRIRPHALSGASPRLRPHTAPHSRRRHSKTQAPQILGGRGATPRLRPNTLGDATPRLRRPTLSAAPLQDSGAPHSRRPRRHSKSQNSSAMSSSEDEVNGSPMKATKDSRRPARTKKIPARLRDYDCCEELDKDYMRE